MCSAVSLKEKLFMYRQDLNGCSMVFHFSSRSSECPPEVNVLAIVLGVIAGIVFFGIILLLIWKLFTTISDKRELARFEKEAMNARWDTVGKLFYLHFLGYLVCV